MVPYRLTGNYYGYPQFITAKKNSPVGHKFKGYSYSDFFTKSMLACIRRHVYISVYCRVLRWSVPAAQWTWSSPQTESRN
jgi:hypothetical protein